MPVCRRGPNGEKIELTPEELETIGQQAYARATAKSREVVSRAQADSKKIKENLGIAILAWQERLKILDQLRDVRVSGTAKEEELEKLETEQRVRDTSIFSAFYENLQAFHQWMEWHLEKDEEIVRVFGYCVRLAGKLGILRRATKKDRERIYTWLDGEGKEKPYFIYYKNETYILGESQDSLQRSIHYCLEALRRRAKDMRDQKYVEAGEAGEKNPGPEREEPGK